MSFLKEARLCLSRKQIHASMRSKHVPLTEEEKKCIFSSPSGTTVSRTEANSCLSRKRNRASLGSKKNIFFRFREARSCLSRKQIQTSGGRKEHVFSGCRQAHPCLSWKQKEKRISFFLFHKGTVVPLAEINRFLS